MTDALKNKLITVALGMAMVFTLCLPVAGYLWLREHDARLRAEVKIEELGKQREAVKTETVAKVEGFTQERSAAKSTEQQIQYVTRYIHTPDAQVVEQPNAAPALVFPDAPSTIARLADYTEHANVTTAKLEGCGKELNLCSEQVKTLQKAQGGFWHRVGECAVRSGIGAGVGGAFGQKKGAIVGGGIGIGSCLVFK